VKIRTDKGNATITLTRLGKYLPSAVMARGLAALKQRQNKSGRLLSGDAVYIPATRLGTIQFFTNILGFRNEILSTFVRTLGGYRAYRESRAIREGGARDIRVLLRSLGRLPLYMEDFYDLILRFLQEGDASEIASFFQSVHQGEIRLERRRELPAVIFADESGYTTEIEAAGSGVVASLPITLGLREVNKGGMLVIEEPEAHLEPYRQTLILKLLCQQAIKRKLTLVLTTHSDFIVKKTLGLFARYELRNADIGLHYFERKKRFSTIRPIDVSRAGEAEQPVFDEAIQSLVADFSAR
jgi:hypothetical protein